MKKDTKPQIDKFREAARELETDEREDAFAALVKKIAEAPQTKRRPEERGSRADEAMDD